MTVTTNKCNGCIYYNSMYLICTKPDYVLCPRASGCIVGDSHTSLITRRCIICDNDCMDTVCDECKDAIKKLKEWLKNGN